MKYMDDLPEEILIEAKQSNTVQVKQPREQESCTVPEAKDPLAEGSLLLDQGEK